LNGLDVIIFNIQKPVIAFLNQPAFVIRKCSRAQFADQFTSGLETGFFDVLDFFPPVVDKFLNDDRDQYP
jgi:hypothetical protein